MRVFELYDQVARLGFEDALEDNDGFFHALNRALLQVSALRPATAGYDIHHKPPRNVATPAGHAPVLIREDGGTVYTAAGAKAYYFEVGGVGVAHIEVGDGMSADWKEIGLVDFAGVGFVPYRGLIKAGGEFLPDETMVRLRFEAPYRAHVRSVAMYDRLDGERVESIPAYEAFTRYDMGELAEDFHSLHVPPVLWEGNYLALHQGYRLENDRVILLPEDKPGVYRVIYRRRPVKVEVPDDVTEDMTVIDLDEDLCALLPLLIASYVWADDEPEKAQYYLTLYGERAAQIVSEHRNHEPVVIQDVNGW